jgi:hypothetical protein
MASKLRSPVDKMTARVPRALLERRLHGLVAVDAPE